MGSVKVHCEGKKVMKRLTGKRGGDDDVFDGRDFGSSFQHILGTLDSGFFIISSIILSSHVERTSSMGYRVDTFQSIREITLGNIFDNGERQLILVCFEDGETADEISFVLRSNGPFDVPSVFEESEGYVSGHLENMKQKNQANGRWKETRNCRSRGNAVSCQSQHLRCPTYVK